MDRPGIRLLFLAPGGASLLLGLYAATALLGFDVPPLADRLAASHGALMVFGFVGTLIVLERAVAIKKWWAFTAPALLGLGSLLVLAPLPTWIGRTAIVLGAVGLLLIYRTIWHRQAMTATAIQFLGGVTLVVAALLWLADVPVAHLIPAFSAFLVLTIAGERLELARLSLRGSHPGRSLLWASLSLTGCVALALCVPAFGYPLFGFSVLWVVSWLVRHDVARRTLRGAGLPRYMAACLLSGYAWLVVAGAIWLLGGAATSGPAYDAVIHAVLLGFTLSMIMAHAPVILPAVLRRPLPYRPIMYLPVALLHASQVLRVLFGDAYGVPAMLQLGGSLNITALLLFIVIAVASLVRGPAKKAHVAGAARRARV
ncbi:hypothetical protein D6T64_05720 [Cryobacterium melibiosiphilum]|uniref:NnrS family protein n=1 Tax=Cryobacterium melibiosiphilum TaxID=995039 RepID=A0A3A5MI37_9MICO|nr:hypothetical protein D6T64_05720 [Cryobacterium melibiosiphilum]